MQVEDSCQTSLELKPVYCNKGGERSEIYTFNSSKITGRNLVLGQKYVSTQGPYRIENKLTGDKCSLTYEMRNGLLPNQNETISKIEGIIRNEDGLEIFRITCDKSSGIKAEELLTGENWTVLEASKLMICP